MDKCDFFNIPLPEYGRTDCSPSLPDEFRGMKITMPAQINVAEKESIPVFGAIQVSSKINNEGEGKLPEHTVIVFVNARSHEVFSFNMVPHKEPISPEPVSPAVAKLKAVDGFDVVDEYVVGMYFNIDALYFFPDFPKKSATYNVYATVLGMKSNVVETKIIY